MAKHLRPRFTAISADTGADEESAASKQIFDPQVLPRFPYITTTHPVHFLPANCSDTSAAVLKLAEIARLIELIGYRHQLAQLPTRCTAHSEQTPDRFALTPGNPSKELSLGDRRKPKQGAIHLKQEQLMQRFLSPGTNKK